MIANGLLPDVAASSIIGGMTDPVPQITAGRVALTQRGDLLVLVYDSKQGPVTIVIDAARLERWALRIMRDEAFA